MGREVLELRRSGEAHEVKRLVFHIGTKDVYMFSQLASLLEFVEVY